ncbi:MAG: S8 family peptidase [Pseudonocardia sp.]
MGPRGLFVLEATDDTAMVVFASDPELTRFLSDLDRYSAGPPAGKQSPPFLRIFDAITEVRELRPDDVIDNDLREGLLSAPDQIMRLDIECWCPEDEPEARRRFEEVLKAVARVGVVIDRSCRPVVGFSMIRADVPAAVVEQIADTTRVRRISRLPRPVLSHVEVNRAGATSLPDVLAPARDAPLLAVIDSGVRSEHPLLRPAVVDMLSFGTLDAITDESGHGTMVASLALYGSLEERIRARHPVRAVGRMISIRVLDCDCSFSDDRIWQEDVARALDMAGARGARVVNLSLGDGRHPYRPPGPVPVAAVVDELARQHDMVVVISSGNLSRDAFPRVAEIVTEYPRWLLGDDQPTLAPSAAAGLAPPAMAALALTVGATVGATGQGVRGHQSVVDRIPMGNPGATSPFSRVGPGIERSIKPELVAPGGSYCFDRGGSRIVPSPDTSVVGAGGTQPDQLLADGAGTSFAAPLVTHAALRVLLRYPTLSANAVRALVLASATPVREVFTEGKRSDRADAHRRLAGFGTVDAERAEASSDHRAVLLADSRINVDEVHFYAVPVPRSFFGGGHTWIRVAIAHDSPVRATRVTYMANRISVFAYRGVPIAEVRRRFAAHEGTGEDEQAPTFPARNTIALDPADQVRCRGANQLGSRHYQRRWDPEFRDTEIVLAVRCTSRWSTGDPVQRYGLAIVLEADESAEPLYAQLRARMRALTEAEDEIQLG